MKLFNRTARVFGALALLLTTASGHAQTAKSQPKAAPLRSDNIALMGGVLRVTPLFHASLMLEYRGKVIYVDPVSAAQLPKKADLILITHSHPDHLDLAAINKVRRPLKVPENESFESILSSNEKLAPFTIILAPPETSSIINRSLPILDGAMAVSTNAPHTKRGIVFVDRFGPRHPVKIEAVPAYNLVRGPKAGQKYHPKGEGNGYILTIGGKRIYIAGDTEATPEMKALKNIDVAFVPMNLPYTMTPQEAAAGVRAFHPRIVYPYHYRYPFDKPNTNPQQFAALLRGSGIQVRLRDWYPPDAVKRALQK